MTERERIDAASEILHEYGITVTPDNEILPLIMSIRGLEKGCRQSIQSAVDAIPGKQKSYHFNSAGQAFFFGLGRWGLAAVIVAAGLVFWFVGSLQHSAAQAEYLATRVAIEKMQAAMQRANDLGYLKDVSILEDERGKYFLLQYVGNSKMAEAGKNFQLIRDGNNHLVVKIYTVYFK